MKVEKSLVLTFVLLVVIASLYRVMPGRPLGFAPQIAMALFGGAVIADKKMSFLLPLLSMLVSDVIYEVLYHYHISPVPGFYEGQLPNYLLIISITIIGFAIRNKGFFSIAAGAFAGTIFYFLASNFIVWIGGGLDINNLPYPKTIEGLMYCYIAGLPFLKGSLLATFFFSGLLFGGYAFFAKAGIRKKTVGL